MYLCDAFLHALIVTAIKIEDNLRLSKEAAVRELYKMYPR